MSNIHILQNIVVDKGKVTELVNSTNADDLKELLHVKDSQAWMLRKGKRYPSMDGIIRLLMLHGKTPADISKVEVVGK